MQKVINEKGQAVFKFSLTEEIQKNQQLEFRNTMLFEQLRALQKAYNDVIKKHECQCVVCKVRRYLRR